MLPVAWVLVVLAAHDFALPQDARKGAAPVVYIDKTSSLPHSRSGEARLDLWLCAARLSSARDP